MIGFQPLCIWRGITLRAHYMSTTDDVGSAEWRALAGPKRGRGRARSQASFIPKAGTIKIGGLGPKAALRAMLAQIVAPDLAGCWLDFVDARLEPVWIATAAGEARDAAAAEDRWYGT